MEDSFIRYADVRYSKVAGKNVIARKNNAFELNETAMQIWILLDGKKTKSEIISNIAMDYSIDAETISTDVDELLAALTKLDLIKKANV